MGYPAGNPDYRVQESPMREPDSGPLEGQGLQGNMGMAELVIPLNNEPSYEAEDPTGDVYLARLFSRPQKLSKRTLQGVRDELKKRGVLDEELAACLEVALAEVPREPPCVRDNARLVIRHDSRELEFVSGRGQCEISVSTSGWEPRYGVRAPTVEVYRERLRSRPQRLSARVLAGIRDELESWGMMTEELGSCFALALKKFPKEPACVRDNPGMRVVWGKRRLRLISKDCEVSVTRRAGKPRYKVTEKSWATYWERLCLSAQPLDVKMLETVRGKFRQLSAPTDLQNTLNKVVKNFSAEPTCLQENARLVIEYKGGELVFVSGKGENKVDVSIIDGQFSYSVVDTWCMALWRVCVRLVTGLLNMCSISTITNVHRPITKFFKDIIRFLTCP